MKSKDKGVSNNCIVDSEYLDISLRPPLKNPVVQFQVDSFTKCIVGCRVVDETMLETVKD